MSLKDIEEQLYGMKESDEEEKEDVFDTPKVEPERRKWSKSIPVKSQTAPKFSLPKKTPVNFFKSRKKPRFLYFIIGALVLALAVEGVIVAIRYFSKDKNVNLSFSMPAEVLMADPFELKISYQNNSSDLLRSVSLILELPKGIKSLADSPEGLFIKRDLGDLGTGSDNSQTFNLVALSGLNSVLNFKATLQYNLPGFASRFEKTITNNIHLNGSALGFNLVLPQNIISGEEFVFEIDYFNNTNHVLSGLTFQAFYPLGFNYLGASLSPADGNNIWAIGDLAAQGNGKILVRGNIVGQTGSFYPFSGQLGFAVQNQPISLDKQTAGVTVQDSPLKLAISVNNAVDYTARPGEKLEYIINYENNTPVALQEVIIKAKLVGDMYDLTSVDSQGYFDSMNQQIVWNAGNASDLKILDKNASGSVSFQVTLKNDYPIKKIGDKNFTVKVQAQMESPSVPPDTNISKTAAVAEINSKISGKADLLAFGLFRDAASGVVNKGTLPLKVGQGTNFTIHWKIINYSNDLTNVTVKAVLPQGVTWTNVIAGNYGESAPAFNDRTGEVIWQIPKLPATTGVVLPARETIFQIAATPSVNQIGQYMKLLDKIQFFAKDDFTGQDINLTLDSITSELSNDPTVNKDDGQVKM